jgi:hypothetical protein
LSLSESTAAQPDHVYELPLPFYDNPIRGLYVI